MSEMSSQDELVKYFEKLGFGLGLGEQGSDESVLKSVTRLNFNFSHETKSFCLEGKTGESNSRQNIHPMSLERITKFMVENPSSLFPCAKFGFSGASLAEMDIQTFFRLHGSRIKELELDVSCKTDDNFDLLRDLLLSQAPNLKLLQIKHDSITSTQTNEFGKPKEECKPLFSGFESAVLPNLENLLVAKDYFLNSLILKEIIGKAPNLEFSGFFPSTVYGYLGNCLELALRFDKIDQINLESSLDIDITPENIQVYEKFAALSPKLRQVPFCLRPSEFVKVDPELQSRMSQFIVSILKSSQATLDSIKNVEQFGLLNPEQLDAADLSFGKISSLHFSPLELMKYHQDEQPTKNPYKMFPGSSLSKMFPSLTSIQIDCECLDDEPYWKDHFPLDEGDAMERVTKLEIENLGNSVFVLDKLACLFPNTETLSIEEIWDFPKVAGVIWTKFLKVKDLNVELRLGPGCERNSFPALDSAFTGLSEELCKKYWKSAGIDLSSMRTGPSIANLQDLQKLTIHLSRRYMDRIENWTLFSKLTGLYGFAKVPGLQKPSIKLNIPYKYVHDQLMGGLSPLKPFVTIFRCTDEEEQDPHCNNDFDDYYYSSD